jgi:hypothetical protein
VPRALTALVALCLLGSSACGKSDEEKVDTTVREFVTATNNRDTKKFCDEVVSQQFLENATGANGDQAKEACRRQLKSSKLRLRLVKISSTKVNGDKATVRAVITTQGQTIQQLLRLTKEDGDWKLAGGAAG